MSMGSRLRPASETVCARRHPKGKAARGHGAGGRDVRLFEALEGRRLLSVSVNVSGAPSVAEGSPYTLNLSATGLPDAVQNWTIDWGDGNVETVAGNPSSVQHVYDDGGSDPQFSTATIFAEVTTVQNQAFAAQGAPLFTGNGLDPLYGTGGAQVTVTPGSTDFGDLASYGDGRYVTVGTSGFGEWEVRRFKADGTPDLTFSGDGLATVWFGSSTSNVRAVAVDDSGRVVVAGSTRVGTSPRQFAIARLTAAGAPDPGFLGNAGVGMRTTPFGTLTGEDAFANDIVLQPVGIGDHKIVLGGNARVASNTDFALARYNSDGTPDITFGVVGTSRSIIPSSIDEIEAVALRTDNAGNATGIVAAGAKSGDFAVAVYGLNGVLDGSFGGGTGVVVTDFGAFGERARDVAVVNDQVLVAGDTGGRVAVARYNLAPDLFGGHLDTTFADGEGAAIASTIPFGTQVANFGVQSDGKIVVGGKMTNTSTSTPAQPDDNKQGFGLFRFGADGLADSTFGNGGMIYTHVGKATVSGLWGGQALVLDNGQILQVGTQPDDPTGTLSNGPTNVVAYRFGVPGGANVFVQNVAPVAVAPGTVSTVSGFGTTFALAADDVSNADELGGFLFTVDWGDGTPPELWAGSPVHAYAVNGTYAVTFVAEDDDGGVSDPVSFDVVVQNSAVQDDPASPGTTMLLVAGSDTPAGAGVANSIKVRAVAGSVQVTVDGTTTTYSGVDAPTGRVVILGNGGDDQIQLSGDSTLPVEIYGGAGDDKLKGGSANDILVGGEGNDMVVGGAGRDLLIGGDGADKLVGDSEDDILIGSLYDGAGFREALAAIMNEWSRTAADPDHPEYGDALYGTRVNNLRDGTGANGFFVLSSETVFDDFAEDKLTGDAGQDWFFANVDGPVKDKITDLFSPDFTPEEVEFVTAS